MFYELKEILDNRSEDPVRYLSIVSKDRIQQYSKSKSKLSICCFYYWSLVYYKIKPVIKI